MKTKAAVVTGARTIEMRELPVPETDEDSGLLRVELTGVCGVDWPAFNGSRPERFKTPIILGHEIVGRVGKSARGLPSAGTLSRETAWSWKNMYHAAAVSNVYQDTTICAAAS